MNKLGEIFDNHDDSHHPPAYWVERRAGVPLAVYLPERPEGMTG